MKKYHRRRESVHMQDICVERVRLSDDKKNIGGSREETGEVGDAVLFIDAFEMAEPPRLSAKGTPRASCNT